tara:strand:+ start:1236 stop:1403 length:168 start_codon:yes stop_codon:yes gene_type:complete
VNAQTLLVDNTGNLRNIPRADLKDQQRDHKTRLFLVSYPVGIVFGKDRLKIDIYA